MKEIWSCFKFLKVIINELIEYLKFNVCINVIFNIIFIILYGYKGEVVEIMWNTNKQILNLCVWERLISILEAD